MEDRIEQVIEEQMKNLKKLKNKNFYNKVIEASNKIAYSIITGGKLLVAGNGGSAADSQHIAAEIVGRYVLERDAYAAIALTTDTSILTAVGNDYSYEEIFSRQIQGLGKSGDVFLGISTSGNSKNIIKAIDMAKSKGLYVIGLTGSDGGKMKNMCDILINFNYSETARVQEHHIMTYHLICEFVEKKLRDFFEENK